MSTPPVTPDERIAWLSGAEIRRRFVEYFAERGHTIVPSASLVPAGDQTLLFTNSGMVQFKDLLTGAEKRSYTRAVDYQRCLRVAGKHNDFEEVGRTPRHHTLFEMLGNWSFGDYFKRDAILWAWDFLTRDLGIPAERLAATTYTTDDMAFDVWRDEIGLPPERLVRWGDFPSGDEKNWWRMADIGPCGPCSEIHFDRGAHLSEGPECIPDHSETCPRWLEVWNLVFMEFELHPDRSLTPLPAPGVDTGMGLERLSSVVQQVPSNYDTDLFAPIHARMRELLGHDPDAFEQERFSYQVIADHSRAVTFLIGDDVYPSNEGRGYVLRRILRRAVRHGRLLGRREPFMASTAEVVIDIMSEAYPHLAEKRDEILSTIVREEAQFARTLDAGTQQFLQAAVDEFDSAAAMRRLFDAIDVVNRDQSALNQFAESARRLVTSLDAPTLQEYLTPQTAQVFAAASNTSLKWSRSADLLRQLRNTAAHGWPSGQIAQAAGTAAALEEAAPFLQSIFELANSEAAIGHADSAPSATSPEFAHAFAQALIVSKESEAAELVSRAASETTPDTSGQEAINRAILEVAAGGRVVGRRPEDLGGDAPVLPGPVVFRLHDTYGFPVDLTRELAAEYGVAIDRAGFEKALAEQRQRSRSGKKTELARHAELTSLYSGMQGRAGDTEFLGYETTTAEGRVVAIIRDGLEYDELTGHGEAELVIDRTPFYAEGGGQVGDQGTIREAGGGSELFTVEDTQKPVGGLIVHRGTLRGRLKVGETVQAVVDADRRAHTMRNHTGTHLLHRALRNVVGQRARQAGSLVTPDYLRFDFPFDRALTDDEKRAIEDEVRRIIREDRPVTIAFMSMAEAEAQGADAFFDEKYAETVRTIRVEDYSFELCGGTHCRATGQIGSFVITKESSIGSGQRRIEALTGAGADRFVRDRIETLDRVAETVGAQSVDRTEERVAALQTELRETKRKLQAGGGTALPEPAKLVSAAELVRDGIRAVLFAGPFDSTEEMSRYAKRLTAAGSNYVGLASIGEHPWIFATADEQAQRAGISAGGTVSAAAPHIGGRGGGRPSIGQAGGDRPEGVESALAAMREAVLSQSEG